VISRAVPPAAEAARRTSMESCWCSTAYLSRKATPKKRRITPARTSKLPPAKKSLIGERIVTDAAWVSAERFSSKMKSSSSAGGGFAATGR
jgi:hypothetical protein